MSVNDTPPRVRFGAPVPFLCPACRATQGADLVLLSRKGSSVCTACGRRLDQAAVSRAIERTRVPAG